MIDVADIRRRLYYDPETGVFTRRSSPQKRFVGRTLSTTNARGYIVIKLGNVYHYAHRLAWVYVTGMWPAHEIDHINGCKDDNRFVNLRDVSLVTNHENLRKAHSSNKTTGLLGASLCKQSGRYIAQIRLGGRQTYIGRFDTAEEAHAAYVHVKRAFHFGSTI